MTPNEIHQANVALAKFVGYTAAFETHGWVLRMPNGDLAVTKQGFGIYYFPTEAEAWQNFPDFSKDERAFVLLLRTLAEKRFRIAYDGDALSSEYVLTRGEHLWGADPNAEGPDVHQGVIVQGGEAGHDPIRALFNCSIQLPEVQALQQETEK